MRDGILLSGLGRDILEAIALRLDDGKERLRFSGAVSKEIHMMLRGRSGDMPATLYRGATWRVQESNVERLLDLCIMDGQRGGMDGTEGRNRRIGLAKKVIIRADGYSCDHTMCSPTREDAGADADAAVDHDDCSCNHEDDHDGWIDVELHGMFRDPTRTIMITLFERILGYCDDDSLMNIPVRSLMLNGVNFGSEHRAMIGMFRHDACLRLRTLHLQGVSVLLSDRDSIRHLESLEELRIEDSFVSIVPPSEDHSLALSACLPWQLKRICLRSSHFTVSLYEWIRLCSTTLADSCEELILVDITCCHSAFNHGIQYPSEVDVSCCKRLRRIEIRNDNCYRKNSCMPNGVSIHLNNDVVECVDIDDRTTSMSWRMKWPGPSHLHVLKGRTSTLVHHLHIDSFSDLSLPKVREVDLYFDSADMMCHEFLEHLFRSAHRTLERCIFRVVPQQESPTRCLALNIQFLNTLLEISRRWPSIVLKFLPDNTG